MIVLLLSVSVHNFEAGTLAPLNAMKANVFTLYNCVPNHSQTVNSSYSPVKILKNRLQVGQIAPKLKPNFFESFLCCYSPKKVPSLNPWRTPFLGGMCDVISGFFEKFFEKKCKILETGF